MKGDEFSDWLNTEEKVFAYKDLTNNKKLKLEAIQLWGKADVYWEQLPKSSQRMGKLSITSWEKMKYMKGYFLPPTYKQCPFMRVQCLKQKDLSTKEFQFLLACNDWKED